VTQSEVWIDDSVEETLEVFQQEADPANEFAYQYEQLLSTRDRRRLATEASPECYGKRLHPDRGSPVHPLHTTWPRLGLIATAVYYAL
jgi:hypothetical protein